MPYKLRLRHGYVYSNSALLVFILYYFKNFALSFFSLLFFLIRHVVDHGPFARAITEEINISKEPNTFYFLRFRFFFSFFFLSKLAFQCYCQKRERKDTRTELANTIARGRHAGLNKRHSLPSTVDFTYKSCFQRVFCYKK